MVEQSLMSPLPILFLDNIGILRYNEIYIVQIVLTLCLKRQGMRGLKDPSTSKVSTYGPLF